MSYTLKENRGKIKDPMVFKNNLDIETMIKMMRAKSMALNIPAEISSNSVKEGGLFGKTYSAIVINHPSQKYFTDVYLLNGNLVNFYYFGESKANTRTNKADERDKSFFGKILNQFLGRDEMSLQTEMLWHESIYAIFESLTA